MDTLWRLVQEDGADIAGLFSSFTKKKIKLKQRVKYYAKSVWKNYKNSFKAKS